MKAEALTLLKNAEMETAVDLPQELQAQREILLSMAGMLKVACEKVDRLEAQIRRMERVTPHEAGELNARIRRRAGELVEEYGLDPACRKAIGAAIRAQIRRQFGETAGRLCRVDLDACTVFVNLWEDTDKLWKLKEKGEVL